MLYFVSCVMHAQFAIIYRQISFHCTGSFPVLKVKINTHTIILLDIFKTSDDPPSDDSVCDIHDLEGDHSEGID